MNNPPTGLTPTELNRYRQLHALRGEAKDKLYTLRDAARAAVQARNAHERSFRQLDAEWLHLAERLYGTN